MLEILVGIDTGIRIKDLLTTTNIRYSHIKSSSK